MVVFMKQTFVENYSIHSNAYEYERQDDITQLNLFFQVAVCDLWEITLLL